MARKASSQRRKANTRPFFVLLDQIEGLLATIDLDWPEDERADAHRRLSRLTRALRLARETQAQRLNAQAAASPAAVSVSVSSRTTSQPWDAEYKQAALKSGIFQSPISVSDRSCRVSFRPTRQHLS
jgi:hypothetical protein